MPDDATASGTTSGSAASESWPARLDEGLDLVLRRSHVVSPDELPYLVAEAAAIFGGADVVTYVADLQQRVLVPFRHREGRCCEDYPQVVGVDSTLAGRAFQQMQPVTQAAGSDAPDQLRLWLPLLDGTERLGVLGMNLPAATIEDKVGMRGLRRFATVVAELVVTKTVYGDSIVCARRTRPVSLAAEVQWSLLPPLTFVNHFLTLAGGLEPAYEVAGDSLDYAVDAGIARFAIFDGMGHGIVSAQLIALVVAAYRNARRAGHTLPETAEHIEAAVDDVFRVESFATGLLCELDTLRGVLTWVNAGHHAPLLLREGRLVRALHAEPMLPLGLNRALASARPPAVGTERLQPGDLLVLYTDGVVEARSPEGEFFGQQRLVDMVVRNLATGLPAPETMRRVVHALLDHQGGDLEDDATLLLAQWHGPATIRG